jgi:Tfp pilus assembly protein PilF
MTPPTAFLTLLLLARPQAQASPPADKVIDVRAARPPAGNTFEALWSVAARAETRGDQEGATAALNEIRRLRVERNIVRLEPFALARVAKGLARLREGQSSAADQEFRSALTLDPHLPDAYFGLALSARRRGVAGIPAAVRYTAAGMAARLRSVAGQHQIRALAVPTLLLALMITVTVVALGLLLRSGPLLLHDIEEWAGPDRKGLSRGVFALLLLLPVIALQGWGWLPLWWLALLFLYLGAAERAVAAVALVATVLIVPLANDLDERLETGRNPLFQAGLAAVEGGPDSRARALLEAASGARPQDRDLAYLTAALYKKGGRYEDAAGLYSGLLQRQASDAFALNNLGNLAFANGEFQAAIPRYKQALDTSPPAPVAATLYYNMSQAHYQKFEPQQASEARSHANRLDNELTRQYDTLWKYDFADVWGVVDLRLTREELWRKFYGATQGVVHENVAGTGGDTGRLRRFLDHLPNRFVAALPLFGVAILALSRWRGPRAFTMRCIKCGTPFCRHCHIGTVASGLCTQCHHLFVVRDGVSGPARNQKLLEVQREDVKRERIFRLLSLVAPGSGHVYARRVLSGTGFVLAWALLLSVALVAGLLLPFTDTPSMLAQPWGWALGGLVMLAVYVAANRARPDFEVFIPAGRQPRRGGRAA